MDPFIFVETRCAMSEFFSPYDADRPLMLKCSCGKDHTVAEHQADSAAAATAST